MLIENSEVHCRVIEILMKKGPWAANATPQDPKPPPVVRRLRPPSDGAPTVPHRRPLSATAFPVAGGVATPFANFSTSSLRTTPNRDEIDRPKSGRAMSPIERELPRLPGDDQPPPPPDRDNIYMGVGECI